MSSLRSLVTGIVDYAGLFPPAGLEMDVVVENYASYLGLESSWMLGRLIVPAARLAEFETAAKGLLPTSSGAEPWRISALVPSVNSPGDEFQYAVSGIQQFNARHSEPESGLAQVDVIETRVASSEQILETSRQLPLELTAFLELPIADSPSPLIETIGQLGDEFGRSRFFAKIRTGGIEPQLIPSSERVAAFILASAEHFVSFKATAGLHHPIRGEFNLTYEPDSSRGKMHGFVNMFVAACFAFSGVATVSQIVAILEVEQASEFVMDDVGIRWNGLQVSAAKVGQIRRRFATSFGSCSFVEPTTELQAVYPFN